MAEEKFDSWEKTIEGSILHNMDSRLKVGILTGVSILMTFAQEPGLFLTTLALVALIRISGTPWKIYRPVFWVLIPLGFFYVLAAGWIWSDLRHFWQGYWSMEGVKLALILVWRLALIFLLTRLFLAVTPPLEQGLGIAYYFTPLTRLTPKAADFALLLTLTIRFIPMIKEEGLFLWKAWSVQGNGSEGRFRAVRDMAVLLPALLLSTLQRAEEVGEGMQLRGYVSGNYQVVMLREWSARDSWGLRIFMLFALLQIMVWLIL